MVRVMQHVEAHELVNTDRGVHVVATTLAITYVGWLQGATEHGDGWVTVFLTDFTGIPVSLLLRSRMHVHIEPFAPLHVGNLVVRAGYDDPEHKNYRRPELGQVERIAQDSNNKQVYSVLWEREREPRWHTRRMLQIATEEQVEEIRSGVRQS
jgi:hypothetical protein